MIGTAGSAAKNAVARWRGGAVGRDAATALHPAAQARRFTGAAVMLEDGGSLQVDLEVAFDPIRDIHGLEFVALKASARPKRHTRRWSRGGGHTSLGVPQGD